MRQRRPKMAPLASKVCPDGSKWAHLGPLLSTLEALLATCGIPLRIFTHFYQVFVNICAFSLKIHEKPRKIQQTAPKITNIAQKYRKSASKRVKMPQGRPKMAQPASKVSQEVPKYATLVRFGCTFGHLVHSFTQFYAFL